MDPWNDLPRLPDPMADSDVPGPDDPHATALLEEVLMLNSTPHRRARSLAPLLTAAAVLVAGAIGAVIVGPFAGSAPAASAAAIKAIDATEAMSSGLMTRERKVVAVGATQTTEVTIRFDGDDFHLTNRSQGSIIDDVDGQFTPDLLEVITVDSESFIRLEPMQPDWAPTQRAASSPLPISIGEQLRRLVETANDFDRCESGADGIEAFCTSTTDPDLVAAFEIEGISYIEVEADLRIEVDTTTGLLHRLVLDGSNATIDPGVSELVVPTIESIDITTTFENLGDEVLIEAP